MLMDTPGFDEQHTEDYRTEMESLKTKVDRINLVGIIINGQTPRVDASFLKMVDVLEDIFGPTFFSRSVVIFTKIAMNSKAKAKRLENTGKTDVEFALEFLKDLHKRFLPAGVPYLFLDSFFDNKNQKEGRKERREGEFNNEHWLSPPPQPPLGRFHAERKQKQALRRWTLP